MIGASASLRLSAVRSALFIRIRSLGDTVLFTPAIENFKRACPEARLSVLLDAPSAEVLSGDPRVDEILVLPEKAAWWRTMRFVLALLKARYDLVVDFHAGPSARLLTLLSGARWRVGWQDSRFARVYNVRVPRAREVLKTESTIHTVAKNLAVLKHIGIPISSTEARLYIDPAAADSVRTKLARFGVRDGEPLLLLHIGATKKRKEYPEARLAELLSRLAEESSMRPVVMGAKSDLNRWEQVRAALPVGSVESVVSLVGELSIGEVKALCETASIFVGPDSGIMHIADTLGTPCVALFGKAELRLWHPWQSTHIVLRPCLELVCDGCEHNKTAKGCISQIPLEEVLSAVFELEEAALKRY